MNWRFWEYFTKEKPKKQVTAEEYLDTPYEEADTPYNVYYKKTDSYIPVTKEAIVSSKDVRLPDLAELTSLARATQDEKWVKAFRWYNIFIADVDRRMPILSGTCRPCYDKVHFALNFAKQMYDERFNTSLSGTRSK